MSTPSEDAQREMEQRALRNVRALVDKYEDQDAQQARSVRRIVFWTVAIVLGIVALSYLSWRLTARQVPTKTYDLPPPASAPR
ncbi:MAG TPA: hypothetical protein VM073_11750 [Usitatibacter sp.]|nr:hypothetical protein [Usitatibacter sp.]